MAEDERLREALLELELLRDREARVLQDTRVLLECLQAISAAPTPGAALASIFLSLNQRIGADVSLVLRASQDGPPTVAAADDPSLVGTTLSPPVDLFDRSRNVTDLAALGAWTGALDFSHYTGLIVAPAQADSALLCLRRAPRDFARDDTHLVERLAGLAVQALQASDIAAENALLAAAIAGSSSGFAIADATRSDRPLVYVNKAFEAISGYSAADVLGQNCRFLTAEAPDGPERVRLRAAVRANAPGKFLLKNKRKSGEEFWNELTLFPVRDAGGTVRSLVATQSDVSDRIAASADRDRARARMESALAATSDAFLILEEDGTVAFANTSVDRLFPAPGSGWAPGTAFDDNWAAYLSGVADMPGRITQLLRAPDLDGLASLPAGREIDLPDGLSVLLRAARLEGGGFVLSATNVTAMKSAQQLLTQRLAAIEAATDGIAVSDDDGRLMYLNSAAAALLGFKHAASGLGRRWFRQYAATGAIPTANGFETTLTRRTAQTTLTHEITGSPLASGGAVIVIRDVTETLATAAREDDLTRDLIRLQRQEAIAQLTAGIAHDFNNLLSAINGSAVLIGMTQDLPDAIRPHLDRIQSAGTQAAKLVNRLLDIGAAERVGAAFDLASVLADLPELLSPSLPGPVGLEITGKATAQALRGDPSALSQVLINLCLNAADAIGHEPGRITLGVAEVTGDTPPDLQVGQLKRDHRYACITVADTGPGMDAQTQAGAFQPYFTTKGRSGTGLGLAVVAMHVQSIGGAIALRSAGGQGTEVRVYWPVASRGPAQPGAPVSGSVDLSGMTVLVVDDDAQVGQVIAGFLEAQGAEVAACEDPRDAAQAIAEDPDQWSALITDYDMPGLNGGDLAALARAAAPDLPILVVTALARRLTDPRLAEGKVTRILAKPVDLDELCAALADTRAPTGQEG